MERSRILAMASPIEMAVFDVDGVMTDGRLYYTEDGRELKAFNTQDGMGLKRLQRAGVSLAVITGRRSTIVEHRMNELAVEHVYQGADNKIEALNDLMARTSLSAEQICYAGDDIIDVPVMSRVGLAISVPNGHQSAIDAAHWVTPRAGGFGAVRDICDLLMEAREADR